MKIKRGLSMIITKMNITMIITKNRLLTCGINNEVWKMEITK
mgnify:CR=1 FL=1